MEGKMDLILVSKSGERNIATMNGRNSVGRALANNHIEPVHLQRNVEVARRILCHSAVDT
jgi:hypothetical protein